MRTRTDYKKVLASYDFNSYMNKVNNKIIKNRLCALQKLQEGVFLRDVAGAYKISTEHLRSYTNLVKANGVSAILDVNVLYIYDNMNSFHMRFKKCLERIHAVKTKFTSSDIQRALFDFTGILFSLADIKMLLKIFEGVEQ